MQKILSVSLAVLAAFSISAAQAEEPMPSKGSGKSSVVPPTPTEYSRTLYRGYASIDKVSLNAVAELLEQLGCKKNSQANNKPGVCVYERVVIQTLKDAGSATGTTINIETGEKGDTKHLDENKEGVSAEDQKPLPLIPAEDVIFVYPKGYGFGPVEFAVSETRVYAIKDITGPVDVEKYKTEVRSDLDFLKAVVKINENDWTLVETIYPWDVAYSAGSSGLKIFVESQVARSSVGETTAEKAPNISFGLISFVGILLALFVGVKLFTKKAS